MAVYSSFNDVPLDELPTWEGDDSIPVLGRPPERQLASLMAPHPSEVKLVVPYAGELSEGDTGDAVYGIKRCVARATGTLPLLMSQPAATKRTWGQFLTRRIKTLQTKADLKATGIWDTPTWSLLAPWADQLAIQLMHPIFTDQQRDVLSFLMAFYNDRFRKRYSQQRPTQLRPVKDITEADCSGSVATAMWTAGVLPKVDWRWTNTDTQIHLGLEVPTVNRVNIADVVFYGHGSDPNHETCVVATKGGVKVFSFGSYPAKILEMDYNRGSLGGRIEIRRFAT